MAETDYRFPTDSKGFAKMLFTLNSDVFGNRLENAERWLQERIERRGGKVERPGETDEKILSEFLNDHGTLTKPEREEYHACKETSLYR